MADQGTTDTAATRAPVRLSPMQVPKASDVLADDLRERILRGEFPEGTALPPERELVTQTGMSRTTVREALRILEVQGLVRIKTGRAGGAFVQQPGEESIASSVNLLIRGRQIRMAALLETREAIEPSCAQLAARAPHRRRPRRARGGPTRRIAADGSLASSCRPTSTGTSRWPSASHNELLTGFMLALSRAIYTATDNQGFVDAEVRKTTVQAHRSITEAIKKRDAAAAVRRMQRHVHAYAEAVLEVEDRTAIDVGEG